MKNTAPRIVTITPPAPTTLAEALAAGSYAPWRPMPPKRNDIKTLLKYGHVMIDGVVTTGFKTPVGPENIIDVNLDRPFAVLRHQRLKIVYEDDDVIVVNKGYGLLSMSTDSKNRQETAFDIVRDYLKRQDPRNRLFLVHRLDRDTSGLMMFAKNIESQQALRHNWNNMVLDRRYVAVLEGQLPLDEGEVRSYLLETPSYEVYSNTEGTEGKLAVTRYRVLERGHAYTLAEFSLDTGRKNQIRVHAKDLGHPITGDRKYGAKRSPIHRLALHARTLRFAHPRTHRDMWFELPVPSKFIGLVRHS